MVKVRPSASLTATFTVNRPLDRSVTLPVKTFGCFPFTVAAARVIRTGGGRRRTRTDRTQRDADGSATSSAAVSGGLGAGVGAGVGATVACGIAVTVGSAVAAGVGEAVAVGDGVTGGVGSGVPHVAAGGQT